MNLYEAIFARKSVRKYQMNPLREEFMQRLHFFLDHLQPLHPEIGVDFLIVDNTQKKTGVKGKFRISAPYYLLLSSELKKGYLENAGYLMQQITLYLTAKGIGNCYQGCLKPDLALRSKMKFDYCLAIAFGESPENVTRESTKAKRLEEKQVVVYKEEAPENICKIVKAARWSPSAYNEQPWRLVVYQNRIHVFCKKGFFKEQILSDMKRIDIGCMLANVTQAAEELWLSTTIVKMENIEEKKFKNNEYILSIFFQHNNY